MIRSFKDSMTEDVFHGVNSAKSRKLPNDVKEIAIRKLDQLNASVDINDMRVPPGNHLEKLKGDLKDFYSLRINNQYRLLFQWDNSGASNVSIVDYH